MASRAYALAAHGLLSAVVSLAAAPGHAALSSRDTWLSRGGSQALEHRLSSRGPQS